MDYHREGSLESKGVRAYTHKFELGMQQYYYLTKYEEDFAKLADVEWRTNNPKETYTLERKTREGFLKMRNEYMIKDMRFILRVTLQLYDNSIGQIEWPVW